MFIVTTVVITITITVTVLVLLSPVTYANGNCANGCIFLGKDLGFVERELLPSYNLTRPPVSNSYNDPSATIYVSIASYR